MTPQPAMGVLLHALSGFAAGSFYSPLKLIRGWAWESLWLVMGLGAWLAAPWVLAYWTIPRLGEVLLASPASALVWAVIFGALWGLGNLTFGLSVRYLGMGLGYAVALGFCMVFGTLIPPLYAALFGSAADKTKLVNLVMTTPGQVVLLGIAVCLGGIAFKEWRGTRFSTRVPVLKAIVVLILSTGIIGYGNYLDLLLQKSAAGFKRIGL